MKKLLIILISLAAFLISCSDDNDNTGSFENQNLSLSAEAIILDVQGNASEGAQNAVTITSTADWKLTGDVSWCTPSVTKGNTGTTVTFTAEKNNTGEYREVNLFFICGNAAKKFTVKQFPEGVVEFINLSDTYTMSNIGGRMTVKVNTNLDVFNTEISEDWVSLRAEKDNSETKWLQFVFDENKTFYDRPVNITMFKGTDFEKVLTVTQSKYAGIILESPADYIFDVNGGKVTIQISGNVNFSPTITTSDAAWINAVETSSSGSDVITKTYEITCASGVWTRSGKITFAPTTGARIVINISQVDNNPEIFDIPDKIFSNRLISLGYLIAKDNQYYLSYTGYIATSLSFSSSNYATMKSADGIERFINLKSLTLYYVDVKKLDLSKNTKITSSSSLNVDYLPLEVLNLGDLTITNFSVTNLYNMANDTNRAKSFSISSSKLTSLTLAHTTTASYDEVEWIDVTRCPALTSLNCNRNSGKLKFIYVTAAQKAAYDGGTLKITTNANFDKTTGIVVK